MSLGMRMNPGKVGKLDLRSIDPELLSFKQLQSLDLHDCKGSRRPLCSVGIWWITSLALEEDQIRLIRPSSLSKQWIVIMIKLFGLLPLPSGIRVVQSSWWWWKWVWLLWRRQDYLRAIGIWWRKKAWPVLLHQIHRGASTKWTGTLVEEDPSRRKLRFQAVITSVRCKNSFDEYGKKWPLM